MKPRLFACAGWCLSALALLSVSAEAVAQEKVAQEKAAQEKAAQEKTPEASRQYNVAVGLHNTEAYDLAADEWGKFLSDHKDDPRVDRAWHYLGVCYSKQNKLDKAAETFQTVVKSFPQFELLEDTYLNLGLTQYNIAHAGKVESYDAAAATFRTLATKYPEGKYVADAAFYEGECLYNRDKKKEAAERYALVVKDHSGHPITARAMFALGVTQTDLGQDKAALTTYADFLKGFPDDALATEAIMWQGESQYALGQYDEAVKSYATAAAFAGFAMADYATVRGADALSALRRYAEAAELYASVSKKYPNSQYLALCEIEAGKKYYAAADFAKAQPFLAKVIAAGGSSAVEAAHWMARSLLKESKPAEALAVVDKILPVAADDTFAAQLSMDQADAIHEIADRRGESVALYAALAAKYPADPLAPQALYMAAFAAMNAADYKAALTHADAFMAAHADHELAAGTLHVKAESSLLSGKVTQAETLYDDLLAKYPTDQDAEIWRVHRGTALYLQKKYDETIAALSPVMDQITTPDLVAEAWYRIGRSQAALKQYDPTIEALEASLAAGPKWKLADDTLLVLAYAYQQTRDFDKAKQNAKRVIDEFVGSKLHDMAHYRLAECNRLGRDLAAAVTEYQLILEQWPESVLTRQTLYGLGWAQLGQDAYADAEKTFTTLVDKYPDDKLIPRARYGRGTARQQLKKYAPAIDDIQTLLATDLPAKEKSRGRHVMGLCQKGLKKYADAVATFTTLIEEDPEYVGLASVYFETGWALKLDRKEPEAADRFGKLVEQFPDSSLATDSHYLIGDFQYDQKEYKKAALSYHAAMTGAGKTDLGEEASYKLGLAYYMLDDLKNAQQTFHYQRATWPGGTLFSDAAYMEAECMFKQEAFDEALQTYALVKDPSSEAVTVLTLLHSGNAAGKLGDWQKSLDLLTDCVEKHPDSPHVAEALFGQGRALHNLDKLDEAMVVYQQVLTKSAAEPAARAQLMIGEIQFSQKKHADAIKSFFKVSYGYGYPQWQADAVYEAGRCFEVLGQKTQALKQYQKLVKEFAQSDKVPLAKQRIEALEGDGES